MSFAALASATLRYRVGVLMLALSLVLVGVIAALMLPVELLPKGLTEDQVSIVIPIASGTPLEVQEQVVRPSEEQVRTVSGIQEISTVASTSRAVLRVKFARGVDVDLAVAEVRDRLERARLSWPEQVRDYFIRRFNVDTDLPIFSFAVDLERDSPELTFLVEEKIRKPLESLPGVAMVDCWGLLEDQVRVNIDRDRALSLGIDIRKLVERLAQSNVEMSAGEVQDGNQRFVVRTDARLRDVNAVRALPIDDKGLRLGDIATIEPGKAVRDFLMLARNKASLWFQVKKESTANTVATADVVRKLLTERIQHDPRLAELGAKVRFYERADMGRLITSSLHTLREGTLIGGVLAVVVLVIFLRRLSPILVITGSLPLSMLFTLAWLYFGHESLNILSLLGLTVAVGMLVDDAIVVVENIARHREMGHSAIAAAREGAAEVGLPVTLSTLTTVLAFLPIIFMGGDQELTFFTSGIGLPLCVAVMGSLVVTLIFVPLATVVLDRKRTAAPKEIRASWMQRAYGGTLSLVLKNRLLTVLLVLPAVGVLTKVAMDRIPKTDVRSDAGGWIEMDLKLDRNFTLRDSYDVFKSYGEWLDEHAEEFGIEHFWTFFNKRGGEFAIDLASNDMVKSRETAKRLQERLPRKPGVKFSMALDQGSGGGGGDKGKLTVAVHGPDAERLVEVTAEVARAIEAVPGVLGAKPDLEEAEDEVHVLPDRDRAALYGVEARAMRGMIEIGLHGWHFSDLLLGEREVPLYIQFEGAEDRDLPELRGFPIPAEGGDRVALEAVAQVQVARGLGEIRRKNGQVRSELTIEAADENREATRGRIREALAKMTLPEGFGFEDPGDRKVGQAMDEMTIAVWLAIVFIFLLMGMLFESFLLPLAVLITIPFSWAGAAWALAATGGALDFVGAIGILVLVGVVVKNGIVYIDYAHRLREAGVPRHDALVEAGRTRLRPILMTALTTIMGLLPSAFGDSSGSQISYKALSLVVIGGLVVSTVFTLYFVPLLYALLDDLRAKSVSLLGSALRPAETATRQGG